MTTAGCTGKLSYASQHEARRAARQMNKRHRPRPRGALPLPRLQPLAHGVRVPTSPFLGWPWRELFDDYDRNGPMFTAPKTPSYPIAGCNEPPAPLPSAATMRRFADIVASAWRDYDGPIYVEQPARCRIRPLDTERCGDPPPLVCTTRAPR